MEMIKCKVCGQMMPYDSTTCPHCGSPVMPDVPSGSRQTININTSGGSNGLGVAGLVLALLGLFLGWIPVLGWVLWLLGLIFSFVGLFRRPRGCAIAGFVISFIDLILLIVGIGFLAAIAGLS